MIDALKSEISKRGGLARTNRFKVFITSPTGVNGGESMSLLCESVTLPGRQITSFEYPFLVYRHEVKVPNGYMNEDVTMNFIITNDFYVHRFFENWMKTVIDFDSYTLNYTSDYAGQIEVHHLNEKDQTNFKVKFFNAWPITMSSVELSQSDTDQYARLPITFTYEDFANIE